MDLRDDVAAKMYDAYCAAVGGKAFNGDPLPGSLEFFSDENKKLQSEAWLVVADVAIEAVEEAFNNGREDHSDLDEASEEHY